MASTYKVLYVGFTNGLEERARAHWKKHFGGFTAEYNVNRLVWFEEHQYVLNAIQREKQIKKWRREWKINLVESINPKWRDLSEDWHKPSDRQCLGDSRLRGNEKRREMKKRMV